jgi:hypothetical protein
MDRRARFERYVEMNIDWLIRLVMLAEMRAGVKR